MRHKIVLSITALILSLAPAHSAQTPNSGSQSEPARRELLKMGEDDQRLRQEKMDLLSRLVSSNREKVEKKLKLLAERQNELESRNKQRLDEIVRDHGWPKMSVFGNEATGVAFLIVQHAELEYQKKYFPLIKEAAARREARPSDLAMLEDRILIGAGKKQLYGTQLRFNQTTQRMELYPIEDEANVDSRRAAVGLAPLAQYLKQFFDLEYAPPKKN